MMLKNFVLLPLAFGFMGFILGITLLLIPSGNPAVTETLGNLANAFVTASIALATPMLGRRE